MSECPNCTTIEAATTRRIAEECAHVAFLLAPKVENGRIPVGPAARIRARIKYLFDLPY